MERVRKKSRNPESEGTVKQDLEMRASSFLASALPASSYRGVISASVHGTWRSTPKMIFDAHEEAPFENHDNQIHPDFQGWPQDAILEKARVLCKLWPCLMKRLSDSSNPFPRFMNKFFRIFNLVRLSLFQIGFGIMLGFVQDILNRVMIKELFLPATIALGLISLKELLAILGVKVWAGNLSDRYAIFGYRRTPYVLIGLVSCIVSFILAPTTAYEVRLDGTGSLVSIIFSTLGDVGLLRHDCRHG